MPLYTPPNLTGGIDDAILDTAASVPALPIGLLVFTFFTVLVGGSSMQNRRTGYADIPLWSLLASVSILLLSLIMTMKKGLIDGSVLGIVVAITIITGLWYFMSNGRNQV